MPLRILDRSRRSPRHVILPGQPWRLRLPRAPALKRVAAPLFKGYFKLRRPLEQQNTLPRPFGPGEMNIWLRQLDTHLQNTKNDLS